MTVLFFSPVPALREGILEAMPPPGHEVVVVESAAQCTARLARGGVGVLILDLAASDGLKFLRKHAVQRGPIPVLCVADRRRPDASSEALRLGVIDIIARPVRADNVRAAIANAREFTRVARQAEPVAERPESPVHTEGVFGASPGMRDVLNMVRRVGPSRCSVLIVGERGTGREMVARAIHGQDSRRDRPFVKIICGDVGSVEFEYLLSGKLPPGGTVYFEDLEELASEAQVRLEAHIRRIESTPDSATDAAPEDPITPRRFLGSAHPRIFDTSGPGAILPALLQAIAVVRLDLPPLRQRSQDIPLLAMHFLKEACVRAGVPSKTFSRSALTLLAALPWPGNAGELRSLADRLAVLIPRGVILLEDVLAHVRLDQAEALGRPRESLREARERFERDYVSSVLQHHRGRMAEAARHLGIERTNLYRKIKQLNIRWTIQG